MKAFVKLPAGLCFFTAVSLLTLPLAMADEAVVASAQESAAVAKPCVAIAPPKAQLGQGASGEDMSVPVQNLLASYLEGPMLNVIVLESKLPAQLKAEAKMAGCEVMLSSNVTHKKKKKFGKAFSIGAGVLSSALPYAGVGGSMGSFVAATTVANTANVAANAQVQQEAMESLHTAQGAVLKGDTMLMDYTLQRVDSKKPIAANKYESKAEADGHDLISPMIEQTATEVFEVLHAM